MDIWIILLVTAAFIALVIVLVNYNKKAAQRYRRQHWRIGDHVTLNPNSYRARQIHESTNTWLVTLAGWTKHEAVVKHANMSYAGPFSIIGDNVSCLWREKHKDARKEAGGQTPLFPDKFKPSDASTATSGKGARSELFDKPVELLSEVECEVALNDAIKNEQYELAEAIRARMEKFR